jgi:hypothetical protein
MRSGGAWQVLTSFAAVNARCARVAETRRRVPLLPAPYTPIESTIKGRRMLRRWFIVLLLFLLTALAIASVCIVGDYNTVR